MSLDLVDLLKGQLGNAVAGQLGKSLGIGEKAAGSGLEALIPVILGKAIQQTSTKSGADDFAKTLDREELRGGGLLDNLGDLFGGGKKQEQFSGLGDTLVKSLFGDKLGAFMPLLSKLLGIDSGKSGSLLGMVVPLVLSFLSKQKASQGLDAAGFANLLGTQKNMVAKAMPAGFSEVLGLGNILPSVGTPSRPSVPQAQSGGGIGKLLIPILILAGLAFFAYRYFGAAKDEVAEVAGEVVDGVPKLSDIELPNLELPDFSGLKLPEEASELSGVFTKFNETVADIKDEASAKLALPKFEDLNGQFDSFSEKLGSLPDAVKSAVSSGISGPLAQIEKWLEQVYAIPGVRPILEPVVKLTIEKIKSLAGV